MFGSRRGGDGRIRIRDLNVWYIIIFCSERVITLDFINFVRHPKITESSGSQGLDWSQGVEAQGAPGARYR